MFRATLEEPDKTRTLEVDLVDVLAAIEPFGASHQWTVLWLRGTGTDVRIVEHEVEQAPNGISMPWSRLCQIASQYDQVEDAVVLASRQNIAGVPRFGWEDHESEFDIIVEVVDSSYWMIASTDKRVHAALRREFPDRFSDRSPSGQ